MDQHISTPITEQIAENLQAGDYVYLNGTIYVARDAAHKRMAEALDRGEELPIPIQNATIYYMGPSPAREGRPIGSAGPTTANVARMLTYRPLPGQEAKTVTITMKILSRPSGEGTDYASMPVLASKDITLTVQPLTQEELDTAAAFMKLVCTEDVYWEGIRKANADRDHVTGDMRSFIEIVPATTGYKFIRNMDSYNAVGVKADDIPGWYDAQQYRCFRSSNNAVVAHETLLVTQPKYNTHITVDSVLTYTQYAIYNEKFQGNGGRHLHLLHRRSPHGSGCRDGGSDGEPVYLHRQQHLSIRYHRSQQREPYRRRQRLRQLVRLDVHRQWGDAH